MNSDTFSAGSRENLAANKKDHTKHNSLRLDIAGPASCPDFGRKEVYHSEGSIKMGKVKLLRDFYESVFLNESRKVRETLYKLSPSVKERVRMLENIIVGQAV
ncbi:hypothetical protein M970_070100 [Encephalitozoon cuniculi EcunIII-L]|uniref:Uncharacterized protein n=1 Tax=Encephalitozoon cuniculi TaxID=6035 RepID=M1KAZ7_ENCCN|nr:hypothetical protein ECU07_0170 [Encephalitozoon cuniculi]KMV65740.1 hypothetical protein M970_070100 [Encephalitozoon cuniculi EcunIII-L]